MQNDKITSATRLFSMIKQNSNISPMKTEDNKNVKNFQITKEKKEQKDRGEFLKRLIKNEEEDDNNDSLQNNYNVYSRPKMIYLDDKNDSYQNILVQESEIKSKNKNINSIMNSKEINHKESEESEEKNNYKREETKRHQSKNTTSIKSKKRNTHSLSIKKKSGKTLIIKNSPNKLKNNTVLTKYSINNITNEEKEFRKIMGNTFKTLTSKNLNTNNIDYKNDDIISDDNKLNLKNNINTLIQNAIKNLENIKIENLEQLKIGDIVILINIFTNDLNEKNKEEETLFNDGIVYPEIIVSKQLFCLPLSKINDNHRSKSLFKRSLFRIETPQNFFQQNQFEKLKNSYKKKIMKKIIH